ncbi:TlpA disulfide reductase family protein [Sphingobacterium sp.]|uniref:TlpA family protein disulfide reductase n=1 Tax=Sphingobacterium sp. TaxID=341027 RepID=UPI00258E60D7|nr:TlpA disulfide reductase family protein [Sphingobacterium sp.]WET71488.1 MAG: TlpA disulfide reductase family protein [Sphingobacterium sp.]
MKKPLLLSLGLFLVFINQSHTQEATLTIDISSPQENTIQLDAIGVNTIASDGSSTYKLINNQFNKTFTIPHITKLYVTGVSNSNWRQQLYISPGDHLHVRVDSKDGKDQITITGKGSENNQPFYFLDDIYFEELREDSLPDRLLVAIQKNMDSLSQETKRYITQNKPAATFEKVLQYNLAYTPAKLFLNFYGNHKFYLETLNNSEKLTAIWKQKRDSLLAVQPLNNAEALISPIYKMLLGNYILQRKEELWATAQSSDFLSTYYSELPSDQRAQAYSGDPENLLQEKIINKEFTGQINEYLYAYLLQMMSGSKKTNATAIFDRFKAKYPTSLYRSLYEPMITEARINEKRPLNEKMVFLDSGGRLKKLDDVINLFKGRTVLVDMWGTWCGPCHQEIEKNAHALKTHFKNKDLQFLYISNYDLKNQINWKKLIRYYNMEGSHVLASRELSEDAMNKTGSDSFPTYFIIKKDGTYELSKAGYPMERELLIKQLEEAMSYH